MRSELLYFPESIRQSRGAFLILFSGNHWGFLKGILWWLLGLYICSFLTPTVGTTMAATITH
jgi:hypothetical protein